VVPRVLDPDKGTVHCYMVTITCVVCQKKSI
jgi:hypothetical protein